MHFTSVKKLPGGGGTVGDNNIVFKTLKRGTLGSIVLELDYNRGLQRGHVEFKINLKARGSLEKGCPSTFQVDCIIKFELIKKSLQCTLVHYRKR